MEIWKDIENYEGLYQISNYGRVKNLERKIKRTGRVPALIKQRILKPLLGNISPYYQVCLYKYKPVKRVLIHRLVAQHFVPNPENKPYVNHIDNNPLNNHHKNLEWVTQRENVNHGNTFRETSSIYPGVCWHKRDKKWTVSIYINGKDKHLGYFTCELEAAQAYQNALNNINT